MKLTGLKISLLFFFMFILSPSVHASLSLNVKIARMVGNRLFEINKTVPADYNKEVIVGDDNLKNRIVFNLKKFTNVLVNGKKINPVQVDIKIIDDMQKIIGKPQTITSFYQKSAQFEIRDPAGLDDMSKINVTLNFEEN